jgi:hypothetical protein
MLKARVWTPWVAFMFLYDVVVPHICRIAREIFRLHLLGRFSHFLIVMGPALWNVYGSAVQRIYILGRI